MAQIENDKMVFELTTEQAGIVLDILQEKLEDNTPDELRLKILPLWGRIKNYLVAEETLLRKC